MPRYSFHLYNDVDAPDDEGKEFPDLAAAKAYAMREARVLAGEQVKDQGHLILHHRIDIADDAGAILDTVRWSDAIDVKP